MTAPASGLHKQVPAAPLIPVSGPMPRRDRTLRHLGVRETLELADALADRIEATDPAGAALLREFRRCAAAALIREHDAAPMPANVVDLAIARGFSPR